MLKCIGCETVIPPGAKVCPMCGAKVKQPEPATPLQPAYQPPQQSAPQIIQHVTEVHHHHNTPQAEPIQIEATSKKWKKLYLYAWLLMFFSFTACAAGAGDRSGGMMGFGMILFVASVVTYIRARAGAWWHHG